MTKANGRLRQNGILAGLNGRLLTSANGGGEIVHLKLRQKVYDPDESIDSVYFPLSAVISVVTRMQDGALIEIGTVGREGTSGIPLIMGSDTTANESFCQVAGDVYKMPAKTFRRLLGRSRQFRVLLNRYLQAYINMLGQLAACNRLHSVYERCSRWILMTLDRVGEPEFVLTHEFLAMMLGTRRSGVTIAAAAFQNAGFIHYARGKITILDRAGLEASTCECYELTRRQFTELLRPSVE